MAASNTPVAEKFRPRNEIEQDPGGIGSEAQSVKSIDHLLDLRGRTGTLSGNTSTTVAAFLADRMPSEKATELIIANIDNDVAKRLHLNPRGAADATDFVIMNGIYYTITGSDVQMNLIELFSPTDIQISVLPRIPQNDEF